jgi:hypothetical protein
LADTDPTQELRRLQESLEQLQKRLGEANGKGDEVAQVATESHDESIESWLDRFDVDHAFHSELSLEEINKRESHRNQARIGEPINQDHAVSIGMAYEQNESIPPIIVYRRGRQFVVVDGNHRIEGAEMAGRKTLPAYEVVGATETQIRLLTYLANVGHGLKTTEAERVEQALHMIDMGGLDQAEAARLFMIRPQRLSKEIQRLRAIRRIREIGVRQWQRLPDTTILRLAQVKNDEVLKPLAEYAVKTRMTTSEANRIVSEIGRERTVKKALAIIQEEERRTKPQRQEQAGGAIKLPLAARKIDQVARLVDLIPKPNSKEFSPEIRERVRRQCLETAHRLAEFAQELSA